jgi:hypothetical protein
MQTRNIGILINQGDDFALTIGIFQPTPNGPVAVNLTGYEFLGEIRDNTGPTGVVIEELTLTIQNQATNPGQVVMSLTNSQTSEIATTTVNGEEICRPSTPYIFDVKMKNTSSQVTRILQGIVEISPQVTQESFS